MLPIAIPVDEIMRRAQEIEGYRLTVDLGPETVTMNTDCPFH